jgi:hypothetical protein
MAALAPADLDDLTEIVREDEWADLFEINGHGLTRRFAPLPRIAYCECLHSVVSDGDGGCLKCGRPRAYNGLTGLPASSLASS